MTESGEYSNLTVTEFVQCVLLVKYEMIIHTELYLCGRLDMKWIHAVRYNFPENSREIAKVFQS